MVVEVRGIARDPVLPGAQQPAVRAGEMLREKARRTLRGREVAILAEHAGAADEGADRERVPAGEDLLVASRLRAPLARREERASRPLEDRVDGGAVAPKSCASSSRVSLTLRMVLRSLWPGSAKFPTSSTW